MVTTGDGDDAMSLRLAPAFDLNDAAAVDAFAVILQGGTNVGQRDEFVGRHRLYQFFAAGVFPHTTQQRKQLEIDFERTFGSPLLFQDLKMGAVRRSIAQLIHDYFMKSLPAIKTVWMTTKSGEMIDAGSPAQLLTFGLTVESATSALLVKNPRDYAIATLARSSPVIVKRSNNSWLITQLGAPRVPAVPRDGRSSASELRESTMRLH